VDHDLFGSPVEHSPAADLPREAKTAAPKTQTGTRDDDKDKTSIRDRLIKNWPVALVAVVAGVTGSIRLGTKSLWLDESYTANEVLNHGSGFWSYWFHADPNMMFYTFLLHFWTGFGSSEADLRSLSVVAFVAAAVMVYVFATHLFGRSVGTTAGLFWGITAFGVTYAQTVRSYSLFAFISLLASYLFLRGLGSDRWGWWIAYSIIAALTIYTHFFGVFVILSHGVYFLVERPARPIWKRAISAWVGFLILVSFAAFHSSSHKDQINWIPKPNLHSILQDAYQISGSAALFAAFCVAIIYAIVLAVQKRGTDWSWNITFLLIAVALPPILTLLISAAKPILIPYYLIEILPPPGDPGSSNRLGRPIQTGHCGRVGCPPGAWSHSFSELLQEASVRELSSGRHLHDPRHSTQWDHPRARCSTSGRLLPQT